MRIARTGGNEGEHVAGGASGNGARRGNGSMRIAVPIEGGRLAMHLGHCAEFMLFDVDTEARTVTRVAKEEPPAHQPGVLPQWLASQGADVVLAGGMGRRAQQLFAEHGVEVHVGIDEAPAMAVVKAFLEGRLRTGVNICDH